MFLLAWAVGISIVFLGAVCPRVQGGWVSVVTQVLAYGLIALPAFLLRPPVDLPLGLTPRVPVVAAVLIVAATVFRGAFGPASLSDVLQHVARSVSAGVGEELLFRGALFSRLRMLIGSAVLQDLVGGLSFAGFHIPVVVITHDAPVVLAVTFALGVLFSILRRLSRGLLLPVALHVAVDISG